MVFWTAILSRAVIAASRLGGCLLVSWLLCAPATPAWCQSSSGSVASGTLAEDARLKGLEFIRSQQQSDGSWEYEGHSVGITALCTLSLIENGAPLYDTAVEKGYRYVKKNVTEEKNTYDLCLATLLLSRVGDRQDRSLIRLLGARLLAGQNAGGGWTYTCPLVDVGVLSDLRRIDKAKGSGDNSCTQFGVLGLWVASRYGVPIEDAMNAVGQRFVDTQNDDGGWGYAIEPKESATSRESMSSAGLFCLTVARATRIRDQRRRAVLAPGAVAPAAPAAAPDKNAEKATLLADPVYASGLASVGRFAAGIHVGSARYFLWSAERLGVLLGLEKLGETDWFTVGADALVKSQKEDGSWPDGFGKNGLSDTCFGVLFLRKANLGSDISRLLEGEPERQFLIANRPEAGRFETIQEALAATQPGDVLRIDGNGPFKLNHEVLNQDLTIQAGFGYDPVLEYQIGLAPNGLVYRPDSDERAQHMLQIEGGTVTLEGLRIEMDAPSTTKPVAWKAILVTGGKLRLLNCSISEGNRRGAACVALTGGSAVIRNCMLVGGRAAIEVTATGGHEVIIDNSVLFSNVACLVKGADTGDVQFKIYQSVIQGTEAFLADKYPGTLGIESLLSVYKCDAIGLKLLPATGKEGRSWIGQNNIYNVQSYIGTGGKKTASIIDPRSFSKFWGDTDSDGSKNILTFVSNRRNGAFTHQMNAQDWDVSEKSPLNLQIRRPGIYSISIGPGEGFSRYREDFQYGSWKRGSDLPLVLTSGQ